MSAFGYFKIFRLEKCATITIEKYRLQIDTMRLFFKKTGKNENFLTLCSNISGNPFPLTFPEIYVIIYIFKYNESCQGKPNVCIRQSGRIEYVIDVIHAVFCINER